MLSKPIRLRGLKSAKRMKNLNLNLVEAYTASWIEIHCSRQFCYILCVEAYTASWIEIANVNCSRMLTFVEAYTASWIEI